MGSVSPFVRPADTYLIADEVIQGMLRDPAQPLTHIAGMLAPGTRVLDVGAGNGNLARVLAQLGASVEIDAVEPDDHARALAAPHYRATYPQLADALASGRQYDRLIFADVIEHTTDPFAFLASVDPLVRQGATALISIPNVSFGAVRLALLAGDFDYVSSGLLEATHLRFFTPRTAQVLFDALDWRLLRTIRLQRNFYHTEIDPAVFNHGVAERLAGDEDARTYQYLFEIGASGQPAPDQSFGATAHQIKREARKRRAKQFRQLFSKGGERAARPKSGR